MRRHSAFWIAVVVLPWLASWSPDPATPELLAREEDRELRGWTIHVDEALVGTALGDAALELLDHKLYAITRAVPADALEKLRSVPIWLGVEDEQGRHPCACYHPSEEWLRTNGYDPAKAGSVDIANATNFLSWSHEQPWMVLHELAHAYHHQVLGYEHEGLQRAFEAAEERGQYEEVLRGNGRQVRHYALENVQEYFAEGSEAWFGTNDFYPFVRAELAEHDPGLAELMAEIWGAR